MNRIFAGVAATLALSGCATSGQLFKEKQELAAAHNAGNFMLAAEISERRLGYKPKEYPVRPVKGGTLHHLEAANAWRVLHELDRAIEHYDAAEAAIKMETGEGVAKKVMDWAASAVTNDTARGYQPPPAEGILSNVNKAVIFWTQGKISLARVEFNRADDRTRRAIERYTKEIEAAQAKAKDEGLESNSGAIAAASNNMLSMKNWQVYDNFMNPAAATLHALFLLRHGDRGDRDRAATLIKRVTAMEPNNHYLREMLKNIKRYGNACGPTKCTWLIVEYGQGPDYKETRMDLPVVVDKQVRILSVALPELVSRSNNGSMAGLAVTAGGRPVQIVQLANMDRVVQTEFSKRWPGIVTRAVVQAATKQVVQEQTNSLGILGRLMGIFYSSASTAADTRILSTMPAGYAIAKLTHDQARQVQIRGKPVMQAIGGAGTPYVLYAKTMHNQEPPPYLARLQ